MLELDPRVLEIAQSELGYVPSDRIDVRLGDARQSIRALPSDAFDIVVGDAFGGLAVPWHLTTTAFLDEVARVLRPGGALRREPDRLPAAGFVRAEAATWRRRFGHVAVIAGRRTIEGATGGNLVLVASDVPLDVPRWRPRSPTWGEPDSTTVLTEPADVVAFIGGSVALTDDFAPVDQLLGR